MKIDLSSIENYAEMTAEEKVAYFEGLEIDNGKAEIDKLTADLDRYKKAVTNANAEAKKYKDERNAYMSEEEKKKQANQEAYEKMQAELETLRKDNRVKDSVSWLVSIGMDAELAQATALAQEDGDVATYRANFATHQENMKKKYELDALANQPSLSVGKTPTKETLEEAELAKILNAAGIN